MLCLVLFRYIRLYKWSKLYSVWRYPAVKALSSGQNKGSTGNPNISNPANYHSIHHPTNEEFYGLRMDDAQSNIYVIRTLHQGTYIYLCTCIYVCNLYIHLYTEINPMFGDAGGSIQAALGALDLSSNIIQQLQYDDADYVIPNSKPNSVAGDRNNTTSKYDSSPRKVSLS